MDEVIDYLTNIPAWFFATCEGDQPRVRRCLLYTSAFHWVKGHAGHPENERCDELATTAADDDERIVDEGFAE